MKMLKKILCLVMSSAMIMMLAAGCSNSGGNTSSTASSGSNSANGTQQTLIIGGSGPLTGDNAVYGISTKQGAELAAEEINANGGINGINFQVMYEDDQADPSIAVNAYATLMDAGMKVSLGGVTSAACIAVTEEVKKDGLLMLTPSASQLECTQYDNCFRVCFTDPSQGTFAADFMAENNLGSKIGIIYDKSSDYSTGIYNTFIEEAGKKGLNIVAKEAFTDQSKTDFSAQIQSIKSSGADLLFLPIYYQEAALIITQSADLDITYFGVDGMDGIIKQMGADNKLIEGVMLLTPFAADSQEENVVKFVSAYKAKYNETPSQFAADGYDAVYAIAEAIKKADIKDINDSELNSKLISAMTQISVDGVTGSMTWSADGEPTKSASALVIKDGQYTAYKG